MPSTVAAQRLLMRYIIAIVFLTFYMEFTIWQDAMLFNDLPSFLCDWRLDFDQCPNDHTTVYDTSLR
ncbi:hypothetical protein BDV09DRAFT_168411 [Aspergillus tetrazonus]